jgi:sugar phosphate isomerase/epimerase
VIEPIGLSTSWNGPGRDADTLLDQHRGLGFQRLEAYAHFTLDELRRLAAAASSRGMHIASLHSPCPVPTNAQGERVRWTDGLASVDHNERAFAVDTIKRSIDAAAEIGARAIVVHLGNTGVASRQGPVFETVARTGRLSDEHRRLRDEAWHERETAKGAHLEAALRSIRELGEHALGASVRIGVECRDGYHEIPSVDEYADVFAATAGLPVGYWHDAGHGAKLEYGGFVEHEEYLRRYGDHLVGMHIHDTREARDHLAPGQGGTDFAMLARYLGPRTIRTLELSPSVPADQITAALDMLEPLDVFGVREGILIEI